MTVTPSDFLGTWAISREIDDFKAGATAQFTGKAVIAEASCNWDYSEEGQLSLAGGYKMQANRSYIWSPREGGFDVFFEDGRFFHHIPLLPKAEASHWCDPDQYEVSYDFSLWPEWRSTWRVNGPRKNYVMTSKFNPLV